MTTTLKIGPVDHGRALTWEEFANSEWELGFQYEMVDGRLYVSPLHEVPQALMDSWLSAKLRAYSDQRPEVVNYVFNKARVMTSNRPGITSLEPDMTCYHNFPGPPWAKIRWQDVSPILVAEILCPADPDKDLVRNVSQYLAVPTIREYWILDNRVNPDEPTLFVHRRRGQRWQNCIQINFGETYTTRLLPGFSLVVDPDR